MVQARQSHPHPGIGAAASVLADDRQPAIRPARSSAGAAARPGAARFARSDRQLAGKPRDADRQHSIAGKCPMTAIDATQAPAAQAPAATKAPWRRSLVRTLLYGRNVDRAAKTKARLGLAI